MYKKILIISDTHIGGRKENFEYIRYIMQFAKENNIKNIIHSGDLFDGLIDCYGTKYQTYYNQITHFIDDYPCIEGINTYVLYGNHDYKFISNGYNLNELLKERKDFINIGIKKGYANTYEGLFEVYHYIKRYRTYNNMHYDAKFIGHSHKFQIDKNKITIPTLSDYIDNASIADNKPGFVVLEIEDEDMYITNYFFNKNVVKGDKVLILSPE